MNLEKQLSKESATEYQIGIDRLVKSIKKHYASWTD